jgi:hypothetical protein
MKIYQLTNAMLLFLGAAKANTPAVDNLRLDDVVGEKFCAKEGN